MSFVTTTYVPLEVFLTLMIRGLSGGVFVLSSKHICSPSRHGGGVGECRAFGEKGAGIHIGGIFFDSLISISAISCDVSMLFAQSYIQMLPP